jgi:hypothetical protein
MYVYGTVLNGETELPLSKSSVYINSSTLGTVTDDSGRFSLWIPDPGYYELIASYVGFESLSYPINVSAGNIKVTFKLKRKEDVMRSVVVMDKDTKRKWMRIFLDNFIGISLQATYCTLLNPDEVFFDASERKGELDAFSYVPLEIENKLYGYRIYFQLEAFHFDRVQQQTYFYGYTRYEEMKDSGEVPKRYLRNRERYYRGSTLNFYHSLLDGKLKENHFSVFLQHSEKPPFLYAPDSVLLKTDSTKGDFGKYLAWKNKLIVRYERVPDGYVYLQRKVFLPLNARSVQSSLTKLADTVYIDPNGALRNPLEIQMGGYWEYEKLGNMLPLNYRPPMKKEED